MMITEELTCATTEGASTMTVAMPDPEDIYSSLLGAHTNTCLLDIPNVRDGNGKLISPSEYEENPKPGTVVMVNMYMKMCIR
jgi:hypothetical protein